MLNTNHHVQIRMSCSEEKKLGACAGCLDRQTSCLLCVLLNFQIKLIGRIEPTSKLYVTEIYFSISIISEFPSPTLSFRFSSKCEIYANQRFYRIYDLNYEEFLRKQKFEIKIVEAINRKRTNQFSILEYLQNTVLAFVERNFSCIASLIIFLHIKLPCGASRNDR